MAISIFLQPESLGATIVLASVLAAVTGVILYVINRNIKSIPFIPFLLSAFIGICFIYGNEVMVWI